jgi:hypothetical protein
MTEWTFYLTKDKPTGEVRLPTLLTIGDFMSVEIRIDSYDISDMDERLEDALNIKNFGSEAFDDNGNLAIDDMTRFSNGSVFQVIQKQQMVITDQQEKIDILIKHIKQLDATVHEITDCLDSAAKDIFSIGMRTGKKK